MTTFIQLHVLTAYAPSNLNRDDSGRPKTARMGGYERLRISSQSLKRAWRTSTVFEDALGGHLGVRTRRIGLDYVYKPMLAAGMDGNLASAAAKKIANEFGSPKKEDPREIEQLVHISPCERQLIDQLVATLISEQREPGDEEVKLLRKTANGVDIAMFGRMLGSSAKFNVEAACQVAHALGVSAVTVEDDFFTAVDDLSRTEDMQGAGHMGEQGYASALVYSYICISRDLLLANLDNDEELTRRAIAALTESALTVAPTGKQNSFASRAWASYALAEIGTLQPRSLAVAFFQPVTNNDQINQAITALKDQREKFAAAYSLEKDNSYELNVQRGEGTLAELVKFVSQ